MSWRTSWAFPSWTIFSGGGQGSVQPAPCGSRPACRRWRAKPDHPDDALVTRKSRASSVTQGAKSGVLVVGTEGLLTQLARCCKPAPPDPIVGFVARGKGVSIHRATCKNFAEMSGGARARDRYRMGRSRLTDTVYPVDIFVLAADRQGLLRDISEIFLREKINVIGVSALKA
jgi:GTP pyrophosphokinase